MYKYILKAHNSFDCNLSKVIKLIKENDDEWEKEASLLSRLSHENILKYYEHFEIISKESQCHPCIITEYCQVIFPFHLTSHQLINYLKI